MDTKTDPYTCCDMRFTSDLKIHRLQQGMERVFHANEMQKKARIAILTSDKNGLKYRLL